MVGPDISYDRHYFRNFSSVTAIGSKEIEGVKARNYADFIYYETEIEANSFNDFLEYTFQNRQISVLSRREFLSFKNQTYNYHIVCDAELYTPLLQDNRQNIISCISEIQNFKYKVISSGPLRGLVDYPFLNHAPEQVSLSEPVIIENAVAEGLFIANKQAGDSCGVNEKIAQIGDLDVYAVTEGFLEGITRSGVIVPKGCPVISISKSKIKDPQILPVDSSLISGGVLEALMYDISMETK